MAGAVDVVGLMALAMMNINDFNNSAAADGCGWGEGCGDGWGYGEECWYEYNENDKLRNEK